MMGKILSLNQKSNSVWLLVIGIILLLIPVLFIVWNVMQYTNGVYIYPFDDTFIHLTIADNLLKGTWGVNPNEFASASSSILYTLLLALFRFFSNSSLVPFVVNCLAGLFIVFALHLWLRKHLINNVGQVVVFCLVIFLTPLPLMIISGMEHTLQCLFSFLFIFYFSDWLEVNNRKETGILPVNILVFAFLLSTIRYEGLFIIAIALLLLLVSKKWSAAASLTVVSMAPILIFGFISLSNGNYFLPNSVLVKSGSFNNTNPVHFLYDIVFEKLVYARNGMAALATQRLLILLPLLYLVFKKYLRSSYSYILILLFGATLLQLSFASTGYMYRYEAYLFFCFMIILPVLFFRYGKQIITNIDTLVSKLTVLAIGFFLFLPIALRSVTALNKTSQACINIYDQQYQMAMFTKKFYNENSIALNDIGAVGYFTNTRITDLWGLANIQVTKSKKHQYWTAPFLDSLSRSNHAQLAIVYDSWFPDSLSKRWDRVATWEIQNNVICGDSKVSFYSLNASSNDLLQQQLKSFEQQLPSTVAVKYY
jgi:hypothetical protein